MWKLLLGALLCVSATAPHKFYFSNTELHVNREASTVEITLRTFTDDTERALMDGRSDPLRIGDEREDPATPALLDTYLHEHLVVLCGEDTLDLAFLGFEVEGYDITWSYLEAPLPDLSAPITIHHTLFLDLFEDQTNSVHCDLSGGWIAKELNRDNTTHTFEP